MAQIAYWIAHPDSTWPGTPTGAQIAAGNLSDNSAAAYAGSETAPGSGSGTITEATAVTGLTASTAYRIAWVVYDDVALTYSNVTVGTESTLSAAITHATSGALEAAGAALSGTAARTRAHPATGVLAGAGADLDGTAARTRVHATSGTLAADGAELAGTAARTRAHASSGALEAGGAEIDGSAARTRAHATSGALEAAGATIDGTAARIGAPPDHATTGALVGQGAAVAGTARRNVTHETSGALTGEASILNAVAVHNRAHAAVGALVAAAAELAAVAARSGVVSRSVTLRLLDKAEAGSVLPSLTGIRWAFFESTNPATWGAPVDQGDAESTDGSGVITFEFPSTSLSAGDVGMLAATISDGDPAQDPPPRSFLIPVTLD